uniref:oligosaccharide flippase family protein n=1 Tax=Undibacterium sp. TaxID=1914977 RepID=UPI00375231C3
MNLYYLISVVGSRIFNLLTIVLLSYFLSAKSFGQYTIVATNAMLLHLFVSSWITNSLWRDASIASEQATSSIIARSIKYGFAVVAPLFAVVPLAFFWLATDVRYLVFILLIAPSILFIEIAAVG